MGGFGALAVQMKNAARIMEAVPAEDNQKWRKGRERERERERVRQSEKERKRNRKRKMKWRQTSCGLRTTKCSLFT